MKVNFEVDNEFVYQIKDAVMVQFLKYDIATVKESLAEGSHPVDQKYDKKLLKAYRTILKYYGETDE